MFSTLRKILVGLIAFGLVVVAFLLYGKLSRTPRIDFDNQPRTVLSAPDGNNTGGDVGTIGGVGIGGVAGAKYFHRDSNKRVDREFGFERLLHQVRDQLDIQDPYMKVFQRNFNCVITADRGNVHIETAAGRPSPSDAEFTGNVVIHIVPKPDSDFSEAFVYLDDVVFVSDKSLFTTAGPVRFLSSEAEMLGRGLELVYNDQLERLEFFKIVKLQTMKLRTDSSLTSGSKPVDDANAVEPVADVNLTVEAADANAPAATGDYYECVLSGNVKIDGPNEVILARDKFVIHDIFWARSDANAPQDANLPADSNTVDAASAVAVAEPNAALAGEFDVTITCDEGVLLVPVDSLMAKQAATEPNASARRLVKDAELLGDTGLRTTFVTPRIDHNMATGDTIAKGLSELVFYNDANSTDPNKRPVPVTITAQRETRFIADSNQVIFDGDCVCVMQGQDPNGENAYVFTSPNILVDLPEDSNDPFSAADITAAGPVSLDFLAEDLADPNKPPMPVNVTASRNARIIAATNEVIFDGDCVCTMLQDDPNVLQRHVLTAPQITILLPSKANDVTGAPDFEHITGGGGLVRLATVKTAKPGTVEPGASMDLGGMELKCQRFDFDPNEEIFTAVGPGIMQVDNSKVPDSNESKPGMSLRKPCYAFVRDFAKLDYYIKDNKVVADAEVGGTLRVDHITVNKDGTQGRHVVATATHVEALMYQAEAGQTELLTLHATGGVTYEDEKNQFVGKELIYDHAGAVVTVNGDRTQPCYFNGALVKSIVYNLTTGAVEAEQAGPGSMQLKQ